MTVEIKPTRIKSKVKIPNNFFQKVAVFELFSESVVVECPPAPPPVTVMDLVKVNFFGPDEDDSFIARIIKFEVGFGIFSFPFS